MIVDWDDRLQEVVESLKQDGIGGRSVEKSTAIMYLLLGEVELGDPENVYAIVTHTYVWARQMGETFFEIVCQLHLQPNFNFISFDHTVFECHDKKRFIFIPVADVASKLTGYVLADVYYDLGPYTKKDLPPEVITLISTLRNKWRNNDEFIT